MTRLESNRLDSWKLFILFVWSCIHISRRDEIDVKQIWIMKTIKANYYLRICLIVLVYQRRGWGLIGLIDNFICLIVLVDKTSNKFYSRKLIILFVWPCVCRRDEIGVKKIWCAKAICFLRNQKVVLKRGWVINNCLTTGIMYMRQFRIPAGKVK